MDNNKEVNNTKPQISNATVERPSIVKELIKYSLEEVIEPKSKEIMSNVLTSTVGMFSDAMTKSIEKWIYPDGAPHNKSSKPTNGVYVPSTNYTVYSRSSGNSNPQKENVGNRSSIKVNSIWVEEEYQAKDIVSTLKEEIDNYKKAKVATLYEMVGITTSFSDFKFGWTQDALPYISYYRENTGPNRGKYYIDLPRPVNIENI